MLKIITDDEILRGYFPNTLVTVDDEPSFFARISTYLAIAELWVTKHLTGKRILEEIAIGEHNSMFPMVARIIVNDALIGAIPTIDLVLTPNGFGVVSNNTVAPASKDRVERLIASLRLERDSCIRELIEMLRFCEHWHDSEQCSWLASSLIQSLDDIPEHSKDVDLWKEFTNLRNDVNRYEIELARYWIGVPLLNTLKKERATGALVDPQRLSMTLSLRNVLVRASKYNELDHYIMGSLIDFIRKNPDTFPEWHNDVIASFFKPSVFENHKDSPGYCF